MNDVLPAISIRTSFSARKKICVGEMVKGAGEEDKKRRGLRYYYK